MLGGRAKRSSGLVIKAWAIGPSKCACRPASFSNASNTPKVLSESFRANQIGVVDSRFARAKPISRNSLTAASLPGLASRRAKSANLIMMVSDDEDGGSNYTTDPQCGLGSGVNETANFVLKTIASSAAAT